MTLLLREVEVDLMRDLQSESSTRTAMAVRTLTTLRAALCRESEITVG